MTDPTITADMMVTYLTDNTYCPAKPAEFDGHCSCTDELGVCCFCEDFIYEHSDLYKKAISLNA